MKLNKSRTISIVTSLQLAPQTLEFLQTKEQREKALLLVLIRRRYSMRTIL